MQLGIFAKTFKRTTFAEILDAVRSHGLDCIQFNFACINLPSMPDQIPEELASQVQREAGQRQIAIPAVSGTFNMIHPDSKARRVGLDRLGVIAGCCSSLGARLVTLCTGTRDGENMWRHHPDNDSPEAWRDLMASMEAAVRIAERCKVDLGIEPETANVIASAHKARRLLEEIRSPRLKIVLDPANLLQLGELPRQRAIFEEAFDLLGGEIAMAHAKDLGEANGESKRFAPGRGLLDYDHFFAKLQGSGFSGPIIMHDLSESEVSESTAFLSSKIRGRPESPGSGRRA